MNRQEHVVRASELTAQAVEMTAAGEPGLAKVAGLIAEAHTALADLFVVDMRVGMPRVRPIVSAVPRPPLRRFES